MFNNLTLSNLQLSAIRELIRAELDRNYEIKENAIMHGNVYHDARTRINELDSLLIAVNCAVAV